MQNPIFKALRFIETKLIPGMAACLFGFAATCMLIEAISRQVFSRSFAVSEELVIFSLIWAILLMLPASGRSGFHIYVDLFIKKVNKRIKWIVNGITALLSVTYCVIVAISAFIFVRHLFRMEIISESPLQLPMWAVCMVFLVGAVLMALFYLESVVLSIRDRGK